MLVCFWLDGNLFKLEGNGDIQRQLRKIIHHLHTFENMNECEEFIRKTTEDKVVLICSIPISHRIIPRVHDLPQFHACYILCQDQRVDTQWTNSFSKIKGVFSHWPALLDQLTGEHTIPVRITQSSPISVVSSSAQSLESRNAMFVWFQLFIEVLLCMNHKSSARQELVNLCQQSYENNPRELAIIDEFDKSYRKDQAIWWYTCECCLYRILNKALRTHDFDMLFPLRFFLTDLSKQLINEHERYLRDLPKYDLIRVYRGQAIDLDELKLIQSSIGEFISMNSFLSTSVDRRTALGFVNALKVNDSVDRILFEIDIDPRQKTKAFSQIDGFSYFQNEGEVLIMLGALFRIQSIERDDKKTIWIAHMSLADENDFQLKETFTHMKQKIGDETNLHSLGKILTAMGEYEQAKKYYRRMIYESQLDESIAYAGLGWADHWLNQYDEALAHLQKSLALTNELLPEVCEEKGQLYSTIGLVHWRQKQYQQALTCLKQALTIQQAVLSSEHPDLLATYNRFAITYSALNEVQLALEYYTKCLNIRLATLPSDHPDIATSYNNIGWLYNERIGDYDKALQFFEKSLAISRRILPPAHRDIVRTEQNIRKVTDKLKI